MIMKNIHNQKGENIIRAAWTQISFIFSGLTVNIEIEFS